MTRAKIREKHLREWGQFVQEARDSPLSIKECPYLVNFIFQLYKRVMKMHRENTICCVNVLTNPIYCVNLIL